MSWRGCVEYERALTPPPKRRGIPRPVGFLSQMRGAPEEEEGKGSGRSGDEPDRPNLPNRPNRLTQGLFAVPVAALGVVPDAVPGTVLDAAAGMTVPEEDVAVPEATPPTIAGEEDAAPTASAAWSACF